jgi:bacillithiol synthase
LAILLLFAKALKLNFRAFVTFPQTFDHSMTTQCIPFSALPMLAPTDRAYAEQDERITPFQQYSPNIAAFAQAIEARKNVHTDRKTLVETLHRQLHFADNQWLTKNVDSLLNENTFTVTTAHQPSLFLGPLYFVYKIFSTIHLSRQLAAAYPAQQFVPFFVIGGEDHDFEEVNNIQLFNKKITWQTDQHGAVGAMETQSLQIILAELKGILGESETAKDIFNIIEKNYTTHAVYQDATQGLLHDLFSQYGLMTLNMNDAALKNLFKPLMHREIEAQLSKPLVEQTQAALEKAGFKAQAFAREINLFYLQTQSRERIVQEGDGYKVLNTNKTWANQAELLAELDIAPQFFSPNVVMRPLYQELVLPNLAYVGGGGELAYWLERKAQFAAFEVPYPVLVRRNSVLWLDKGSQERLQKLDLQLIDLVGDIDIFVNEYTKNRSENSLSIESEKDALNQIFEQLLEKTKAIDPSLEKTVLAEQTKQLQSLDILAAKMLKSEKQKQETTINQVRALAQKFFPNGGLQERNDNFLSIYLKQDKTFFDTLNELLDPIHLSAQMLIISE